MKKAMSGAERVRRRRDTLRAAGLRPMQFWLPDTRAAGFAEECSRQARAIVAAERASGASEQDEWADLSDSSGWTA